MTTSDDFLSRWSRRKRQAAERDKPAAPEPSETEKTDTKIAAREPAAAPEPKAPVVQSEPAPIFDLSKLPSLDSIGPKTDIRMFLQPGVPESLSRAALRRAWSADPAIRDYIGLSENSWDFTAPDSMTGFGPLLPTDDVKQLLAQVFGSGEPDRETEKAESFDTDQTAPSKAQPESSAGQVAAREDAALENPSPEEILHCNNSGDAMHKDEQRKVPEPVPVRRRHGRALPT